jgi:hypothetical protein
MSRAAPSGIAHTSRVGDAERSVISGCCVVARQMPGSKTGAPP